MYGKYGTVQAAADKIGHDCIRDLLSQQKDIKNDLKMLRKQNRIQQEKVDKLTMEKSMLTAKVESLEKKAEPSPLKNKHWVKKPK